MPFMVKTRIELTPLPPLYSSAMSLLKNIVLPTAVEEELHRTIAAIPAHALIQLAKEDSAFARGHRPIPNNAEHFRQRLFTLLNASAPLPPGPLQTIRMHSLYQDFTCVLSTEAILQAFTALAHFVGGAPLLLAMLLDPRETVHQYACDILQSNDPIPEPAPTPGAARTAMCERFSPFIETLEAILLPPPPKAQAIEPSEPSADTALAQERQTLKTRVASLEAKNNKLSTRIKNAADQLTKCHRETTQATAALKQTQKEASTQKERAEQRDVLFSETKIALQQAKDEIDGLRTTRCETQEENERLASRLDELNAHIDQRELAAQTAAANHAIQQRTEFVTTLDTTLPARLTSRTTRERLAASLACTIHEREKLTFLIDGYNVILRAPKYAAESNLENKTKNDAPLKPFRKALEQDVRTIQAKLGDCKINLYYDGPIPGTANPFCTASIKIIFSGGKGEHRADKLIIAYMSFVSEQCPGEKLITITDDNEIREEAEAQGALVLSTRDFIALA